MKAKIHFLTYFDMIHDRIKRNGKVLSRSWLLALNGIIYREASKEGATSAHAHTRLALARVLPPAQPC